jgi:hypothetical protein
MIIVNLVVSFGQRRMCIGMVCAVNSLSVFLSVLLVQFTVQLRMLTLLTPLCHTGTIVLRIIATVIVVLIAVLIGVMSYSRNRRCNQDQCGTR